MHLRMNQSTGEELLSFYYNSLNNTGKDDDCSPQKDLDKNLQVSLISIVIILSLIGNILIVAIVIKNKRMHTLSNLLILNISVADLLVTLFSMVWEVVRLREYGDGSWPLGSFMCVFTFLCTYMSVACSVLSLTIVSIDRYWLIVKPHEYKLRKFYIKYIILGIWITSFLFGLPTIFVQKVVKAHDGKPFCIEVWSSPFDQKVSPRIYTIVLFVCLYVIPLSLMTVLYTKLCCNLWSRRSPDNMVSKSRKKSISRKRKVIIMLIIIVLIFAIGWFPIFLVQFLQFFDPKFTSCAQRIPQWLRFMGFQFEYLSSALNPYVYLLFSDSFQHGFASLFTSAESRRLKARSAMQLSRFSPSPVVERAARDGRFQSSGSVRSSPGSAERRLLTPTTQPKEMFLFPTHQYQEN